MDDVLHNERISENSAYKLLKSYRRRMMIFCLGGSLAPLVLYLAGTTLKPEIFASPLVGGRITLGIVLSIAIFIGSWLFTGYYTYVANTKLDKLQSQILAEVAA